VLRPGRISLPGLYAAGEVIGGATFGGTGYAAGMSVTPALTFGRLLGSGVI
jgi:fumarate reductase flavoprotein subunit